MNTIITVTEFRALCPDSVISDEKLVILLQAVTEQINSFGRTSLEYETGRIEFHKGNDSEKLYLDKRPVVSVTELKVNDVLIDPNDYIINENNYIRLKKSIFPAGIDIYEPTANTYSESGNILVEFDGGFIFPRDGVEGNVPASLKLATCNLIQAYLQSEQQQNLSSYKISDISYTFADYSKRHQPFIAVLRDFIGV